MDAADDPPPEPVDVDAVGPDVPGWEVPADAEEPGAETAEEDALLDERAPDDVMARDAGLDVEKPDDEALEEEELDEDELDDDALDAVHAPNNTANNGTPATRCSGERVRIRKAYGWPSTKSTTASAELGAAGIVAQDSGCCRPAA